MASLADGGGDLDTLARALDAPDSLTAEALDGLRRAVDYVFVGAAGPAALAHMVLLTLAPRRFPVLEEGERRGAEG